MKIFDSHCHPQFPQYDADRDEMIARAQSAGISMICVGTDLETSKQGIDLVQKHNGMWATVGIHPNDTNECINNDTVSMFEALLNNDKVVALGEIGLDYYRTPESEKQEQQKISFKMFLDIALKHDKPIIIHARDASKGSVGRVHVDVIEILKETIRDQSEISTSKNKNHFLRGVVHSFTGTIDEAKKYLDLGFYLGFNGIITFQPKSNNKANDSFKTKIQNTYEELIRYVPLDRILTETDAPYLAPELYRGQRNEPFFITHVVDKLADIKGLSRAEVATQTTQNCNTLFNLGLVG